MEDDIVTVLAALQLVLFRRWGVRGRRVHIDIEGEPEPMTLPMPRPAHGPVPEGPAARAESRAGEAALSQIERIVVEALGRERMTGEQIAERSGYPYDQHLRSTLSAMRRKGILGGERGDRGYWVIDPDRWGLTE